MASIMSRPQCVEAWCGRAISEAGVCKRNSCYESEVCLSICRAHFFNLKSWHYSVLVWDYYGSLSFGPCILCLMGLIFTFSIPHQVEFIMGSSLKKRSEKHNSHIPSYVTFYFTDFFKMPVRNILSSVCLKFSKFFQLSSMQYMRLCVFSLSILLLMIVRIRVLYLIIIIKSEIWPICHCLGLGHEAMVCAVCLSICLFFTLQVIKSLAIQVQLYVSVPIASACNFNLIGFSKLLLFVLKISINNRQVYLIMKSMGSNRTSAISKDTSHCEWTNELRWNICC